MVSDLKDGKGVGEGERGAILNTFYESGSLIGTYAYCLVENFIWTAYVLKQSFLIPVLNIWKNG